MPAPLHQGRAAVSLVTGASRRKNIHDALAAMDDQIRPLLKRRDSVVIKPNGLNATRTLACSHADAVHGVLDYLAPRFKGPVYIAESSGHSITWEVYENFKYADAIKEHRGQNVRLIDLNEEGKYEVQHVVDYDMRPVPIRIAARLIDPRAFVICLAIAKTHVLAGVTLSVKNMYARRAAPPGAEGEWKVGRQTSRAPLHPPAPVQHAPAGPAHEAVLGRHRHRCLGRHGG